MGIIRDFEKIEKAISVGLTDKNTYISNSEIYNAYTMYFFRYYEAYSSDKKLKTHVPNNILSPATLLFRDLVASKISLFFSKFPEWKTNSSEIDSFLTENKEKFEDFFYKSIEAYVLYGNVAVFLNAENELELVTRNFRCVGNSLIIGDRKLEEKSKLLLEKKGVDFEDGIYEVFTGEQRLVRLNKKDYIDPIPNYTNSSMALKDYPFVYYLWDKFVLLEELHAKIHKILAKIKHYAITNRGNREDVEKIEDFKIMELDTEILSVNEAVRLLSYNDNTPIMNTIQALESAKDRLTQEITNLSKLDLVLTVDKDNTTETRIAATNRVQLSSNFWRTQQNRINNFMENTIKAYFRQNKIGNEEEISKFEFNSTSILEEEFKEQKRVNDIQQISQLILQGGSMPPAVAKVNYLLAEEISKSSAIGENLKKALNELVVFQEQAKQQASQQPQAPNPQDLAVAKMQSDIQKNNTQSFKNEVEAKKLTVEAELLPQKVANEQIDEAQQMQDAETRALRLKNNIQQESKGIRGWLKKRF